MDCVLPPLVGYPRAMLWLVGELPAEALPVESRATCERCPMHPGPGEDPNGDRSFSAESCCTYFPRLASFMVGRALAGRGGGRVRALLGGPGVSRGGVDPPPSYSRAYDRDGVFGVDPALRCPYLEEGELGCAIHPSRGAICRSWFCRYDQGGRGREVWDALGQLLLVAEGVLVDHCLGTVRAPWPLAPAERWEHYFLECARVVDALTPAEVDGMRAPVDLARTGLEIALARRGRPMPALLRTASHRVEPLVGGTWQVVGYSRWDPVPAPPRVHELLAGLREGAAWREVALRVGVGEALVRALWRAEVLVDA